MSLRDVWNRLTGRSPADSVESSTSTGPTTGSKGPAPAGPSIALVERVWALVEPYAVPCVSVDLQGQRADRGQIVPDAAPGPTDSVVGGYGYLPEGATWPVDDEGPMAFVAQVNFAQVPALSEFPEHGLLQWFVSTDDVYGLTFDDTAGAAGFTVRWYDDLSVPAQPTRALPVFSEDAYSPVEVNGATPMVFTIGASLPDFDDLPEPVRQDGLWAELARAHGEDEDPGFTYAEYVRGGTSPFSQLVQGSKIGGHPSFTQWDPRGQQSYPAADQPGGQLLLELDSNETGGWGDAGIGHLFGDPSALTRGDLTLVRYHWDCG